CEGKQNMSKNPSSYASLRLCPKSIKLRLFDHPLPDHDDRTAISTSRFRIREKNPLFVVFDTKPCILPILAAFCVDIQFQPISEQDLHEVKAIYDWYIANSTATFHTEPIRHDQLTTFLYVGDPVYPSYLVRYNGAVAGYCFLTKYKDRPAYRRSAEVTIYLRPEFHGKGIGSAALQRLIQDARANDFKTLL